MIPGSPPTEQFLIIGYGNDLRGDDAVGLHVAQAIDALCLPDVQVHLCSQLTPELAELLAGAKTVIFADAAVSESPGTVEFCPVSCPQESTPFHHALSPGALVQLCESAYGKHPESFMLRVHVSQFELGAELSPVAHEGAAKAVTLFKNFFFVRATQHT